MHIFTKKNLISFYFSSNKASINVFWKLRCSRVSNKQISAYSSEIARGPKISLIWRAPKIRRPHRPIRERPNVWKCSQFSMRGRRFPHFFHSTHPTGARVLCIFFFERQPACVRLYTCGIARAKSHAAKGGVAISEAVVCGCLYLRNATFVRRGLSLSFHTNERAATVSDSLEIFGLSWQQKGIWSWSHSLSVPPCAPQPLPRVAGEIPPLCVWGAFYCSRIPMHSVF